VRHTNGHSATLTSGAELDDIRAARCFDRSPRPESVTRLDEVVSQARVRVRACTRPSKNLVQPHQPRGHAQHARLRPGRRGLAVKLRHLRGGGLMGKYPAAIAVQASQE
jgi:hypothetical protein